MGAYLTIVVEYLVAQSWQIAVLTVAVAAATFALRHHSVHVRHLLWLIVVAKCLVPPLYAVPLRVLPPGTTEGATHVLSPSGWWHPGRPGVVYPIPPNTLKPLQIVLPSPIAPEPDSHPSAPGVVVGVVAMAPLGWITGMLWLTGGGGYLVLNLLRALRGHYWLRKTRKPLPENMQADYVNLLRTYGARHRPRIWVMESVGQPFVWGLLRGDIYIPPTFLTLESIEHRRDILAHELSHVIRFDATVNALQVLAQGLFWFHPFVWWANQQIRREREKCCDEMVLARLHTTPKDYSAAILETLARNGIHPPYSVAGGSRSAQEHRGKNQNDAKARKAISRTAQRGCGRLGRIDCLGRDPDDNRAGRPSGQARCLHQRGRDGQ